MIKKLNLQDAETARLVLELQIASYSIEAELIGFYDLPPLRDSIDSLKACNEIFYGYFIDGVLAGIISYKIINNVLDIHRVAIHPQFFRRGIADQMLHFIEKVEAGIDKVVVCTGKDNIPAVSLYLKHGYRKSKDIEVSTEIYITEFEKTLKE